MSIGFYKKSAPYQDASPSALLGLTRSALRPAPAPPLGEAGAVGFRPGVAHDGRSWHRHPDNAVLGGPVTGGGRCHPKSIYDVFCSHGLSGEIAVQNVRYLQNL
jgi:hypothetical protein